jgi:hypothetical protein
VCCHERLNSSCGVVPHGVRLRAAAHRLSCQLCCVSCVLHTPCAGCRTRRVTTLVQAKEGIPPLRGVRALAATQVLAGASVHQVGGGACYGTAVCCCDSSVPVTLAYSSVPATLPDSAPVTCMHVCMRWQPHQKCTKAQLLLSVNGMQTHAAAWPAPACHARVKGSCLPNTWAHRHTHMQGAAGATAASTQRDFAHARLCGTTMHAGATHPVSSPYLRREWCDSSRCTWLAAMTWP